MIYDRFQEKAISYIDQGYSVIVSAPTGAGKTAIAEYVIADCIKKGKGVIYTAPLKALSNQKFRDFQTLFQDRVGIVTGDVSINPRAAVLIMTTEIFRNKIMEEQGGFKNKAWVIFDEIHYLDDWERGTVWEESIIFLPKHMKILALSATVPNIREFVSWIENVHKIKLKVIIEDKRPVPLKFLFQCHGQILSNLKELKRVGFNHITYSYKGKRWAVHIQARRNRLSSLISYIRQNSGLPCIYFSFGRRRCENLAFELYAYNFLKPIEERRITSLYNSLIDRFHLKAERSAQELWPLIRKGIAYHHAGMLPTLKEIVERLFTSRLLKVIFTTETFALGINMPARSVVFDELRKYYGRYHRTLKTRDFYQMAGRAGRRGMDECGFVYSRINPHAIKLEEIRRIIFGAPEEVRSQFNNSYATILHLYERLADKLYQIYPLSYHYFQSNKYNRQSALRNLESKVRILKGLGYIHREKITDKGRFASGIYGYELPLSELYEQGILEEISDVQLNILLAGIVFEPRKQDSCRPLSRSAKSIKEIAESVMKHIHPIELSYRISPLSKDFYFHLATSIEAWMGGENFNRLKSLSGIDEGEMVRYFRMVIQILRQLESEGTIPKRLKDKARRCILSINRDVVDAQKLLREG